MFYRGNSLYRFLTHSSGLLGTAGPQLLCTAGCTLSGMLLRLGEKATLALHAVRHLHTNMQATLARPDPIHDPPKKGYCLQ